MELTVEEQKALDEGLALKGLTDHPGWEIFKKLVDKYTVNSWADPRGVTDEKEFFMRYALAWGGVESLKGLFQEVEAKTYDAMRLAKKRDEEEEPGIGE
jgi:hypothetical protein